MHGVHNDLPRNRLRELVEQRGLKLVDVAALCRVDQSTVWRWQEAGIPRQHVVKVAGLLGVTVPYLDGWTDDPNGSEVAVA